MEEEEEEAAESITNTNTESNLKLFVLPLINSAWLRSDSVIERSLTDFSAPSRRRSGLRGARQLCRWPYLGVRVPGLQEDLIVEGLPLRVVGHCHSKLPDAGHQVLGDALLVSLLATDSILQLDTNTETIQVQCHQ